MPGDESGGAAEEKPPLLRTVPPEAGWKRRPRPPDRKSTRRRPPRIATADAPAKFAGKQTAGGIAARFTPGPGSTDQSGQGGHVHVRKMALPVADR